MSAQLSEELRDILRELAETIGAVEAWIGPDESSPENAPYRQLGGGKALYLDFATAGRRTGRTAEAALEHAARALRAAGRRWEIEELPDARWPDNDKPSRARILERIQTYLQALANTDRCDNILLARDAVVIAAASPPTELERERIEFAIKQVEADADRRSGTSHGEIIGDDIYVRSFYINAALIGFFSGPWAIDFVRHRARRVVGELAHLLGMLDQPPPANVASAPVPE